MDQRGDSSSRLADATAQAWQAFDRAVARRCGVEPALPILFFGDLAAYRKSPLRVLTVGLNPSLHEFPADEPFRRFPLAEDGREAPTYLAALSGYFRADPYHNWFRAYESLLAGLGTSYYEGGASTALHTDICSPVATDPTWSRLGKPDRWLSPMCHSGTCSCGTFARRSSCCRWRRRIWSASGWQH